MRIRRGRGNPSGPLQFAELKPGATFRRIGVPTMHMAFGFELPWPVDAEILASDPSQLQWTECGRLFRNRVPFKASVDLRTIGHTKRRRRDVLRLTVVPSVFGIKSPFGLNKEYVVLETRTGYLRIRDLKNTSEAECVIRMKPGNIMELENFSLPLHMRITKSGHIVPPGSGPALNC